MGWAQLHYEAECAATAPRWVNPGRWVAWAGAVGTAAAITTIFAADGLPGSGACVALPLAGLGWWLTGWWWRLAANSVRWRRLLEVRFDAEEGAWRRGGGPWQALRGELALRADGALVDRLPAARGDRAGGEETVLGWDFHGPRIFADVLKGWAAVRQSGESVPALAKVEPLGLTELPEKVKAHASIDGVNLVLNPANQLAYVDRLFALLMPIGLLGGPALVAWGMLDEGWPLVAAFGLAVPFGVVFGLIFVLAGLLAAIVFMIVVVLPLSVMGLDPLPDAQLTLSATRLQQVLRRRRTDWNLAENGAIVWLRPGRSWGVLALGPPGAEREVLKGDAAAVLWLGRELNQLRELSAGDAQDVPDELRKLREGANRRTTR